MHRLLPSLRGAVRLKQVLPCTRRNDLLSSAMRYQARWSTTASAVHAPAEPAPPTSSVVLPAPATVSASVAAAAATSYLHTPPFEWDANELNEALRTFSRRRIMPVTLKQFTDHAKGLLVQSPVRLHVESTKYLCNELPVRLAHAIKELETLPSSLRNNQHIKQVLDWYKLSFKKLVTLQREWAQRDLGEHEEVEQAQSEFVEEMDEVFRRHATVVMTVARGVEEYKRQLKIVPRSIDKQLDHFLDRFFMSRIGIRTLISQHLALYKEDAEYTGIVDEECDVQQVMLDAARHSSVLMRDYYGKCPELVVKGPAIKFPYIAHHLYLISFEVLKNAQRAVVEWHAEKEEEDLPPVHVRIAAGVEDLTLRISDEGGGVSRTEISKIFTYTYSTAYRPVEDDPSRPTDMLHAPVAGLGYGLPISRLYARYLGGDLQVMSMEGHGTDVFVYLNHRAHLSEEVLPRFESGGATSSYAIRDLHPWQRT